MLKRFLFFMCGSDVWLEEVYYVCDVRSGVDMEEGFLFFDWDDDLFDEYDDFFGDFW